MWRHNDVIVRLFWLMIFVVVHLNVDFCSNNVITPMVYYQVDFWILDRMDHSDCYPRYKDRHHNIRQEYTVTVFPCYQNICVMIVECYKRHVFCNHASTFDDHFRDDRRSYMSIPKDQIEFKFQIRSKWCWWQRFLSR